MGTPNSAHRTKVKIGDGGDPETFTEIPEITDGPEGPGFERRIIEASTHNAEGVIKKAGLPDTSPVTFMVLYDSSDTQHAALKAARTSGATVNIEMEIQDAGKSKFAFAATVSEFKISSSPEDFVKASVSLVILGTVAESTWT